jgi:hypothetical protein
MSLGNGQTHRVAQFSREDCRRVGCAKREECFTLAMSGNHPCGGKFFEKFLKDLGALRS